jgi:hypothetical protein
MTTLHTVLPTCAFDSWQVTALRDSLLAELANDEASDALQMFFYAITHSGWSEIRRSVMRWKRSKPHRTVVVYVGTDHAVTDPAAIELMQQDEIEIRLMETYRGVFHPKLIWLKGNTNSLIWICSNNLTKDGLLHNIEFAVLVKFRKAPSGLIRWAAAVASGSSRLTAGLFASYKEEREEFENKQATAKTTTFTWSRKHEPKSKPQVAVVSRGDLILEIMPEETRGGTQIQFPKEAVKEFLGIQRVGEHKTISLQRKGRAAIHRLVVTVFENNTVRLSVNDLEYGDRPCVIVFRRKRGDRIIFEIVPDSIFPTRYRSLLALCTRQTRAGSRHWMIIR